MMSGRGCTDHSQLLNNYFWFCIFRRSAASDKKVKEQLSSPLTRTTVLTVQQC